MKLVRFTLPAHLPSVLFLLRQRCVTAGNGLGTGLRWRQPLWKYVRQVHNEQVRATHKERRRGQRPLHYDQVPATHKERLFGQRPGHHGQVLETTTTIKNLRGAAGIGLGTTINYP
jgi:hypothetical protein